MAMRWKNGKAALTLTSDEGKEQKFLLKARGWFMINRCGARDRTISAVFSSLHVTTERNPALQSRKYILLLSSYAKF